MKKTNNREYRDMSLNVMERGGEGPAFLVEGFASTFEPYILFSENGIDYKEQIARDAFDEADLSDVVFRVEHSGRVYARSSAGTVKLNVTDKGLHNVTDLSKTERGRALHESIAAGNYPNMSFAFTVGADHYDRETHTRIIDRISKVYDISPVAFPANPTTELFARDYFHGVMEAERAERLETERREALSERIKNEKDGTVTMNIDELKKKLDEINNLISELMSAIAGGDQGEGDAGEEAPPPKQSSERSSSLADLEKRCDALIEQRKELEGQIEEIESRSRKEEKLRMVKDGAVALRSIEVAPAKAVEKRAAAFLESGRMEMRALLSTGKIAKTVEVDASLGNLDDVISSIVDDVRGYDATGTGTWRFPYRTAHATAEAVTEGSAIGGTEASFDFIEVTPTQWGCLQVVGNQVKKMSPVAYTQAVERSALLALRKRAVSQIVAAVSGSKLAEKVTVEINQDYLRSLALGFTGDDAVYGGTKLYINKADLVKLGKIRGTNEKRALYEIKFSDLNNGTITEGGLSVPFCITSELAEGTQLFGQPQSIAMPMWGNYSIETDEGGKYFETNTMAIRGLQTAGVGLTVYHGMQVVSNSAFTGS